MNFLPNKIPDVDRNCLDDLFLDSGNNGYWWSATDEGPAFAWCRILYYSSADVSRDHDHWSGFSVRCVKD